MDGSSDKKHVTNIKDLADILDLSVTTVSRVLNGKADAYRISKPTQEKVNKAVTEFNYIPNKLARSLKLDKTETIGLIVPDISNPFFADIAKSIENEARKKGFSIILCDSADNIVTEEQLLLLLQSQKVDGIIVAPVGTRPDHLLHVHKSGLPIVVIDRYFPQSSLPYITSDNFEGAYNAVRYLISCRHTRIACIQGIHNSQPNIERVAGFKKALKDARVAFDNDLLVGNSFSKQNGYEQSKRLFQLNAPPSAIFALSNLISLGVLEAAAEVGWNIPDDVSIISFDEQPYSAYLSTPMTTIDQQKHNIGKHAVDYLSSAINSRKAPETIGVRLPTHLIKRKSVKKMNVFSL